MFFVPLQSRGRLAGVFAVWLVAALVFLLLVPYRGAEFAVHDSRFRRWLRPPVQMFLVGISPRWGALSGLVLSAWCYFVIQWVSLGTTGMGLYQFSSSMPDLAYTYGLPLVPRSEILRFFQPGWMATWLVPLVLFAANLALVLARRQPEPEQRARAASAP
jgi:hypothetical protein